MMPAESENQPETTKIPLGTAGASLAQPWYPGPLSIVEKSTPLGASA
jgi:hypothetical protein